MEAKEKGDTMTKSKRKRLRKQGKLRPGTDSEVRKSYAEGEEIIVIKTRGFFRNEKLDLMEDRKKAYQERMKESRSYPDTYYKPSYNCGYTKSKTYNGYVGNLDLDTILEYINGPSPKKNQEQSKYGKQQSSEVNNKKSSKTSGKKDKTFVKTEKNYPEICKKKSCETKQAKAPHGKVFAEELSGKNVQEEKIKKKNISGQGKNLINNDKENPNINKKKTSNINSNVLNSKSNDQNVDKSYTKFPEKTVTNKGKRIN